MAIARVAGAPHDAAVDVIGNYSGRWGKSRGRNAVAARVDEDFSRLRGLRWPISLAPLLPYCTVMMTTPHVPMLRWTFTRNHAALTCEVDANAAGGYEVSVVPHWNVASAAIERFDAATTALERHAEVSEYLRETGWHLARRGTGNHHAAA